MKMPAALLVRSAGFSAKIVSMTMSRRAAGLKHFRACGSRNTRQFKFLEGCGGQHGDFGPALNRAGRPSFSLAKPPICRHAVKLQAKKLQGESVEIQRRDSANEFAQTIFKLGKSGLHCGFGHGWFSATAEATLYTTFAREQIASKGAERSD